MIVIDSSGKHTYSVDKVELYIVRTALMAKNIFTGETSVLAVFDSSAKALAAIDEIIYFLHNDGSVYNLSYSNGVIHDT